MNDLIDLSLRDKGVTKNFLKEKRKKKKEGERMFVLFIIHPIVILVSFVFLVFLGELFL